MRRINYLIKYLENETTIANIRLERKPELLSDKKNYFRSLVNTRNPAKIDEKFLKEEAIYLKKELKKRKGADSKKIKVNENKIGIWKGDITALKIDAIVNVVSSNGVGCFLGCHDCIANQVQSWAGVEMRYECSEKMKELGGNLEVGKSYLTGGYNLPAKYIIHTAGPKIKNKIIKNDINALKKCYINSLDVAKESNIRNIAIPCIATYVEKYSKEETAKIVFETVKKYLKTNSDYFDKVIFNTYTDEEYRIYKKLK